MNVSFCFTLALVAVTAFGACTDDGPERRCRAPEGLGSPETISEAIELFDALPAPVDLPCILESFDRPLAVELSSSPFSAQPAQGARSPRIFIFGGKLVMSVVPEGNGSEVIEFAEYVDELRSIKAELSLPIQQPIAPSAPYQRVLDTDTRSVCGICHIGEQEERRIDGVPVFSSRGLRPRDRDVVDLGLLRQEHRECDAEREPERCENLAALFDYGLVEHRPFSPDLPPFF